VNVICGVRQVITLFSAIVKCFHRNNCFLHGVICIRDCCTIQTVLPFHICMCNVLIPWNKVLFENLEADNCSFIQEIPDFAWNPVVHYHLDKLPPHITCPDPDNFSPSFLHSSLFLILSSVLHLCLPVGLFRFCYQNFLCTHYPTCYMPSLSHPSCVNHTYIT
jgi:hypothetical protein